MDSYEHNRIGQYAGLETRRDSYIHSKHRQMWGCLVLAIIADLAVIALGVWLVYS